MHSQKKKLDRKQVVHTGRERERKWIEDRQGKEMIWRLSEESADNKKNESKRNGIVWNQTRIYTFQNQFQTQINYNSFQTCTKMSQFFFLQNLFVHPIFFSYIY